MEFKLIVKKINNTLSEREKVIFNNWYYESEEHRTYFNQVQENHLKGLDVIDINKGWDKVSSKINSKSRSHGYWKYAAAIAALLVLGSLPFISKDKPKNSIVKSVPQVKNDPIPIGTDKAILTLEDGSNVALEKGKSYKSENITSNGAQLVYNSGSKSSAIAPVYNVLTIPRGGQFFISLADGTKVWLNSESKLRYPVAFVDNMPREVELVYGEAYFDVSPSEDHNDTHFIVTKQDQKIVVLGTEFNIKAYKEDVVIATTLVEGKVVLKNGLTSRNLAPGQKSILNTETNKISIAQVDVYNEISWKNGFFSFQNKSLEDIMTVLSRWYDVDVVFTDQDIKKIQFNGIFRKTQSIDEILMIIENTNEVSYTINEKTITMK